MILEELDLYLTDKCNLSCKFCSVKARKTSSDISFSKIKEIIVQAKELGVQELHLTGGEPTLRDDLEEIVSFSVSHGLNIRLITNGTLLDKERLKKLVMNGLKNIMISLDGLEDYHNAVRGKNTYGKALQTIDNALELGMFVRVNSVAWRDNQDEIVKLAELLNNRGVHVYSIFLGSPLGYAINEKHNIIDPFDWRKFYNLLQKIALGQNYKTKIVVEKGFLYSNDAFDIKQLEGRGRGCFNMTNYYDYFLIRSNGNVFPCVFFSNEAEAVGNIHDQSLKDILETFKNNNFYKQIGDLPKECEKCKKLSICTGGCRGYAKIYKENWISKDPRCNIKDLSEIVPLCPIVKYYLNENRLGGSSEQVLRK